MDQGQGRPARGGSGDLHRPRRGPDRGPQPCRRRQTARLDHPGRRRGRYRWLDYPTVLGSDVAGEVVEVGSAVTRFQVGDRVLGHTVGTDKDSNAIYRDFLPAALAEGRFVAAPEPHVVGHDLGDIQHAVDVQRRGVSAQKVVVSLAPHDRQP